MSPAKRRFQATEATTKRGLYRIIIERMGATSLNVHEDWAKGAIEVQFDRRGRRYVYRCAKYKDPLDNLRAVQLTIDYLWRAFNEYAVVSSKGELSEQDFDRLFLGFSPPPDDSVLMIGAGKRDWWEVLGIPHAGATAEAVRNAYRALAQVHHPDHGGNADEFKRLREAYALAIAEVGK